MKGRNLAWFLAAVGLALAVGILLPRARRPAAAAAHTPSVSRSISPPPGPPRPSTEGLALARTPAPAPAPVPPPTAAPAEPPAERRTSLGRPREGDTFKIEWRAPAKGSISGRVIDAAGSPVGDARLEIRHEDGGSSHAKSGEGGAFRFESLPCGTYWLTARSADGGTGVMLAVRLEADDAALEDVLVLLLPPATVRGRVIDGSGSGIAEATVSIRSPAADHFVQSGEDGRFAAPALFAGSYTLDASVTGYVGVKSVALDLGSGESRDDIAFVLYPPATIAGRVTGLPDDARERRIHVFPVAQGDVVVSADAAADGSFLVKNVPACGWVEIFARTEDYGYVGRIVVPLDSPGARDGIEVPLGPGARIEGRILDGQGRPAADVDVRCELAESTTRPRAPRTARSGTDGRYAIENLYEGRHRLNAGSGPVEVSVAAGGRVAGVDLRAWDD